MIWNLATKNMKKSMRDYAIYFITLTVAVALSYIFNLLPDQPFMSAFTNQSAADLTQLLSKMSIPITFIVASLSLYSNKFLLKRRSREIGIYLMLGTRYSKVHALLLAETFLISVVSFVAGIAVGMGLSRIFDVIIIKLLGLSMDNSSVFFSTSALIETLKTFGLIFVVIAIFNYFIISTANLLEMVRSNGESLSRSKFKNKPWVQMLCFFLSLVGLLYFYISLCAPNIDMFGSTTMIAMVAGVISHMMLFLSMSGLISLLTNMNKRKLYRGANLFSTKQITSKISRNGIMLGILSLVMSVTMVMLNMGFSSRIWVNENIKYTAPYSLSISGVSPNDPSEDVVGLLKNKGIELKEHNSFRLYNSQYYMSEFIEQSKKDSLDSDNYFYDRSIVQVISVESYNKCRKMLGFEPITIREDYFGLSVSKDLLSVLVPHKTIRILNQNLIADKDAIFFEPVNDSRALIGYGITIIVNSSILSQPQNTMEYTNSVAINTKSPIIVDDPTAFQQEIHRLISENNGGHKVVLQSDRLDYNMRQASTIIFTGLFIGLLLLIVGASILSLQQMSEITESKKGYDTICKLGVSGLKINRSILKQILSYFTIPLLIAMIHSVFGTIAYSNFSLLTVTASTLIQAVIVSFGIVMSVYLLYIWFTYTRCKKYLSE